MITFLLDIIEVPESHNGATLAREFQAMLERFQVEDKVGCSSFLSHSRLLTNFHICQMLAFTGDNATSNDTQTAELDKKKNSFNLANHVRCFNHTVQLSAKALLRPFTTCVSSTTVADDEAPLLEDVEDDDDGDVVDMDDEDDNDPSIAADDDVDDDIDEFEGLSEEEQANFLEETAAVKQTITKVSSID
jgi:hypothetical protein